MTITIDRPQATQAPTAPAAAPEYQPAGIAAQEPAEGKTTLRENGHTGRPARPRKPAASHDTQPCKGCGTAVDRRNRTGLCRACWLIPANRPQTAARRKRQEPAQAIAGALRILERAAAKAAEEDPGEGLALLVQALPRLRDLTAATGRAVVANLGSTVTAAELSAATGQAWSRQRVEDRWIPARRNGGTR